MGTPSGSPSQRYRCLRKGSGWTSKFAPTPAAPSSRLMREPAARPPRLTAPLVPSQRASRSLSLLSCRDPPFRPAARPHPAAAARPQPGQPRPRGALRRRRARRGRRHRGPGAVGAGAAGLRAAVPLTAGAHRSPARPRSRILSRGAPDPAPRATFATPASGASCIGFDFRRPHHDFARLRAVRTTPRRIGVCGAAPDQQRRRGPGAVPQTPPGHRPGAAGLRGELRVGTRSWRW